MADAVDIIITTDYGELSNQAQEVQVVVEYHGRALDIDSPYGDFVSYSTSVTPYSWGEKWTYTFLISQNTSSSTKYGSITFSANGSESSWEYEQAPGVAVPTVTPLNPLIVESYDQHRFNILVGFTGITGLSQVSSSIPAPLSLISSSFSSGTGSFHVQIPQNPSTSWRPLSASFTATNTAGSRTGTWTGRQSGYPAISVSPSTKAVSASAVPEYDVEVTYYNLSSTALIRQPSVDSGLDYQIKSTTVSGDDIIRVYTIIVSDNTGTSTATKVITFENSYGYTGTHTVTQAGRKWASPSTDSLSYWITGSSQEVTVTYYGVSSVTNTRTSVNGNWISVTRQSYSTVGGNIVATYRVTTTTNNSWARTGAVFFHSTAGSGVVTGSVSVGQTAGYKVQISASVNPKKLEATQSYSETIKATYFYTTNPQVDILRPISSSTWITFTTGSVYSSGSVGYAQNLNVHVDVNNTLYPRTGSVTARMRDGNPATGSWVVYQNGFKQVTADTRSLDFDKGSGYKDITVTYWNVPSSAIQTPSSSESWCTISQRSTSTVGNTIVRVYRISVSANSGIARGATVSFTATDAAGEYISVAQAKNSWVEIDSLTTNPLNLDYNDTDWHEGRVLLRNEADANGLTYSSSSNWISVSPGSGFKSGDNYYKTESVKVTENTSHLDRSGSVTFYLSSSQATWNIYQKGMAEAVPASSSGTVTYPQGNLTLRVTYYNARTLDNCRVGSNYDWLTCTRTSYTTSGTDITVTYRVSYTENTGWARQGHLDFYVLGYETNYGRYTLTQGTHVYAKLVTPSPTNVPDGPYTPTSIVDYYHISGSGPISTPSGYPSWIRAVYASGSDQTLDYGIRRGWFAEVQQNNDYLPRTGSITFGVTGGDSCTWTIQQAGAVRIIASTHQLDYLYSGGSQTLTVNYYNVPAANINAPTSNQSWCTVTETSRTSGTGYIRITYRVTVAGNTGDARGATVGFTATGNVPGDYITVAQDGKYWVELDSTTPSTINVPFVDSGSQRTIYKSSVWYRNVRTGSSDIIPPRCNDDWLVLVSSSRLYLSGVGSRYDYFWYPEDNLEGPCPRTDWWFFGLEGGTPDEVYQRVNQEGPKYVDLDTGSISHGWRSGSYVVSALYWNVPSSDIQEPVGAGDWVTISELSRESKGCYIEVKYRITIAQNDDWPRSTRRTFYSIGSYNQAFLNISQSARVYVTLTSASNPTYVSNTPGLDGQLPVWGRLNYFHTLDQSKIWTPISDSAWARISQTSSIKTSSQGLFQDVGLDVANNLTTGSREATFSFGITGGDPDNVIWRVIQSPNDVIVANPRQVDISWSGGTGTTEVSYINIGSQYISLPEISGSVSWITGISEVSRTTEGNTIKITYAITASQNLGPSRGATVKFGCTKPGVPSEYITVAQGQKIWVEIDDDDQYKETYVPARDPSDEGTWYYSTLTYYNVPSGSELILPPVASSDDVVIEYSGSIRSELGAKYVYRVRALDNPDSGSRITSIYFNLTGGDPSRAVWNIIQTGQREIRLDPVTASLHWSGSSYQVTVDYVGCPSESIYSPVISGSWITASLTSREPLVGDVGYRELWNVTIPENRDWSRTGSIRFNAVPETQADPPLLAWHLIQQDTHKWVEVIDPVPPTASVFGIGGIVTSSVHYWHTREVSDLGIPQTGSTCPTGMIGTISRSGLIFGSQGWTGSYSIEVLPNVNPESRTGSIEFYQRDGEPATASLQIEQRPGLEIKVYPETMSVPVNRIIYDTGSSDYPLTVYWKGVDPTRTVLLSGSTTGSYQTGSGEYITGSFSGSWINVTEQSRSLYTSESGSTVVTYYKLDIDRNKTYERTMSVVFRAEEEEAVTVIVQAMDKRTVIDTPPITASASGGYLDLTVYYYCISESEMKSPVMTGPGTINLGHVYEQENRLKADYQINLGSNPGYYSRGGLATFGIVGEEDDQSLPYVQEGKKGIEIDPTVIVLPSRECLAVVGATYYNHTTESIETPVVSSPRIEIQNTTSFNTDEDDVVTLYNIHLSKNPSEERFEGTVTYSSSVGSQVLTVIQGGKPYIVCNPTASRVTSNPESGSIVTASYYNFLSSELGTPRVSGPAISMSLIRTESSAGSLDEEINVKQIWDIAVEPNTASVPLTHWVDFVAGNETARYTILQNPREGMVFNPTSSIVSKRSGSVSFTGEFFGIESYQEVDMSVTGSWFTVVERQQTITSESIEQLYEIQYEENTGSEARSGSVGFKLRTSGTTGSFTLIQEGPQTVEVEPSEVTVGQGGASFEVQVTYRNTSDITEISDPIAPNSLSITRGNYSVVSGNLVVTYTVVVDTNFNASSRRLTATFSKGLFTGTLLVIQAGTQGGKVEILSSNPLNVGKDASIQAIVVRYLLGPSGRIPAPTFSSGITYEGGRVVEDTEGSTTISYVISISENNTGNRRIMTGIFSLLDGGSTYSANLVISQAAAQNISLRYSTSPIWIENILRVASTPSVNLQVIVDDIGQVFNKTVYRAPDATDVEVDLNRILEPYLEASELSTVGEIRKALTGTVLTPSDAATWTVINDWSYKVRDSYGVLSDPPFDTVALGQYLPLTLFVSGSETNIVNVTNPLGVTTPYQVSGQHRIADFMIPINMCGTWTVGDREFKTINSPYVLYYYNKFGGWDSIPVTGIVLPGHEYERNTVGKKRMFTTDYNVIGDKTYELHTGFFTDDQSQKVDDIVGSTKLYLQDTSTTDLIPVRMIDDSVEVKTFKNQERNFPTYTFRVQEVETKKRR